MSDPEHDYMLSERKRGSADELYGALMRMVKLIDDTWSDSEGRYPQLDAGCIECTDGTVPNDRNTGLCAYHFAYDVLRKIDRGQP